MWQVPQVDMTLPLFMKGIDKQNESFYTIVPVSYEKNTHRGDTFVWVQILCALVEDLEKGWISLSVK